LIGQKPNEKIASAPLIKDIQSNGRLKDSVNFYDYHVAIISDVKYLSSFPNSFDIVGEYPGILAFSFWSLDPERHHNISYVPVDPERHHNISYVPVDPEHIFYEEHYSKVLKSYIESKPIKGSNIIFDGKHWLGQVFEKYKKYFSYVGSFTPASQFSSILSIEKVLPGFDKTNYMESYQPFAHTPGGLVVGAIVKIEKTTLILYPIPSFNGADDELKNFVRDFLDEIDANLLGIKHLETTKPRWTNELFVEERGSLKKELNEAYGKYQEKTQRLDRLEELYWQTGEPLEKAVEFVFREIGFNVQNISKMRESKDLIVKFNEQSYVIEVKGKEGSADKAEVSNFIANNPDESLVFIVNHYRLKPPEERTNGSNTYPSYTSAAVQTIKTAIKNKSIKSFCSLTTLNLAEWVLKKLTPDQVKREMEKFSEYSRP
jgi:hypothetical protein